MDGRLGVPVVTQATGPSLKGRLIIVSNRLPVVLSRTQEGAWQTEPGSGGLVTALLPVLKDRGGHWIGWPGIAGTSDEDEMEEVLARASRDSGYDLHAVKLSAREEKEFYYGFANQIIWPMFHDLHTLCNFDPRYWKTYLEVNRKFAQITARYCDPEGLVWIHDYHLMSVAEELKKLGISSKTGFFLHITFPPLDIFRLLPWRLQILQHLLAHDCIGLQTQRDKRNFLACLEALAPGTQIDDSGRVAHIRSEGRVIRIGHFPISIDAGAFLRKAESEAVAETARLIREQFRDRKIALGIDRLDYTKGIPYRLNAFRRMLENHPELHERISLVQIVVPSRREIPEYVQLKQEIERLVGEINGQFTRSRWVPIHYQFRNLTQVELIAYYRAAGIALVTPIKDGMNLVAKEYCICNFEGRGVLILSEFAGAADQLQEGALLVNPFDVEGVARAIRQAYAMPAPDRQSRMATLRKKVIDQDVFWWVDSCLEAATSRHLKDFPVLQEYVPSLEDAGSE